MVQVVGWIFLLIFNMFEHVQKAFLNRNWFNCTGDKGFLTKVFWSYTKMWLPSLHWCWWGIHGHNTVFPNGYYWYIECVSIGFKYIHDITYVYIYIHIYRNTYLSIYLSIDLSIYLSIYLYIYIYHMQHVRMYIDT